MQTLDDYLQQHRQEIEAALERYLPAPPECPPVVLDAMRYSLMAGGKRLRPILTLASAEAIAQRNGGSMTEARQAALPAACAIEMIHTYSLIHDDLPAMDDDVLRRGRPTLHVMFGEGMAILAGDGLHAEAFGLLAREPVSTDADLSSRKLIALSAVAKAAGVNGMVGGQAIDLEAVQPVPGRPAPPPFDAARLEGMHRRKTGALIRASAVAGAVMAGGARSDVNAIDAYALDVGLAFQIVDDILDVEAGAEQLGKTPGKDAAAGKPTYPSLFGVARARQLADDCLTRALEVLNTAGLATSRLPDIARWVIQRRS